MKNENYSISFEVPLPPNVVYTHLNDVSKWWSANDIASSMKSEFEGHSTTLNDEFIIRYGDRHFSKQKLIEMIPDKKVVWLVTESRLNWLERNKNEWTNTKMVFEITPKGEKTLLHFTHEGLVPEQACYSVCAPSWDMFFKNHLYHFMTNNERNQ